MAGELATVRKGRASLAETRAELAEPLIITQRARELQVRPTFTGWTPELVEAVGSDADAGIMSGLADFCETLESDGYVRGVLQQLAMGTFGLPLQFKGGARSLRKWLSGPGAPMPGEWESMHPEAELTTIYRRGLIMGVSPFQRIPLPRVAGHPQRYRLRAWHPKWLSYDHFGASGSHWRIQTKQGIKRVIPGGQFGLFMPFGESRPWNLGAWRALALPWLIKHFAVEDRANQGEMIGTPTWVGTSTQGGTEKQRKRFLAELQKLGRNGRLVLPDGWKLDLVEATGQTWELATESIAWSREEIMIALVSQVTTTQGAAGFDAGKTQDQILSSITRYFAKQLALCLYYQSTQPWARTNTGDERNAPYGYYNTDRQRDLSAQATMLETLGRAATALDEGLDRDGLMLDRRRLVAAFGVPAKSNKGAKPLPVATGPGRTPPKENGRPGPPGSNDK